MSSLSLRRPSPSVVAASRVIVRDGEPADGQAAASVIQPLLQWEKGQVIPSLDALVASGLKFRTLSAEDGAAGRFKLRAGLAGHVCPVITDQVAKYCWLFCTPEYAGKTYLLREVIDELASVGIKMDPHWQVVVLEPALLNQISQGRISHEDLSVQREINDDPGKSLLFKFFVDTVDWGFRNGASDVDFVYRRNSARSYVAFYIDNKWVRPERFQTDSRHLISSVSVAYQRGKGSISSALETNVEQQLGLSLDLPCGAHVYLRWAGMSGDLEYRITLRIIKQDSKDILTLPNLGYLPDQEATIRRAVYSDGGAFIMAGRVNSGKSTTLGACVQLIPRYRKVTSIEDPVEANYENVFANTVSRSLSGDESAQLNAKLATLKRTGFNDLWLGEIRDRETGRAAQDVFEAGQKLYTTVHGHAAYKIPDRLCGPQIGIPRETLGTPGNLRLLVYQALLPKVCSHCGLGIGELARSPTVNMVDSPEVYIARLERLFNCDLSAVRIRNPQGCDACRREDMPELNGYKGRTCAAEMLVPTDDYCEFILRNDPIAMHRYMLDLRGNTAFDDQNMTGKTAMECAIYKALLGEIDPREIEMLFTPFQEFEFQRKSRSKA